MAYYRYGSHEPSIWSAVKLTIARPGSSSAKLIIGISRAPHDLTGDHVRDLTAQARAISQEIAHAGALLEYGFTPTRARVRRWAGFQLEQVHQDSCDAAAQLPPVASTQALDLLGDVRPVELSLVQQLAHGASP